MSLTTDLEIFSPTDLVRLSEGAEKIFMPRVQFDVYRKVDSLGGLFEPYQHETIPGPSWKFNGVHIAIEETFIDEGEPIITSFKYPNFVEPKRDYPYSIHKQTIPHVPSMGLYGDCHRVVIACMLNKRPEEVPHFHEGLPPVPESGEEFERRVDEYLATQNLQQFQVRYHDNLRVRDVLRESRGALCILSGTSVGKVDHSVLVHDSKIVVDPSPSNVGINGPMTNNYYSLTFLIPKRYS
jgi:hypothetical protein